MSLDGGKVTLTVVIISIIPNTHWISALNYALRWSFFIFWLSADRARHFIIYDIHIYTWYCCSYICISVCIYMKVWGLCIYLYYASKSSTIEIILTFHYCLSLSNSENLALIIYQPLTYLFNPSTQFQNC